MNFNDYIKRKEWCDTNIELFESKIKDYQEEIDKVKKEYNNTYKLLVNEYVDYNILYNCILSEINKLNLIDLDYSYFYYDPPHVTYDFKYILVRYYYEQREERIYFYIDNDKNIKVNITKGFKLPKGYEVIKKDEDTITVLYKHKDAGGDKQC